MTDDADDAREERPLTDQERADLYREQLKRLHVADLVRDMMVTLVTVGYEKLGLTEQTRELRDLTDARVAIEALRRLIEVVEGEGDPEAASLRSTLAQMQLNYARASAETRPAAPSPEPARQASAPAAPQPRSEPAAEQPASRTETPERGPSEAETKARVEDETPPQKTSGAPRQSRSSTGSTKTSTPGGAAPAKGAPAKAKGSPAKGKGAGGKGGSRGAGGKGSGGAAARRRTQP